VIDEVVRRAGRRFGDRAAFVDPDGSRLSYAELDRRSDRVAAGLTRAGIRPGDVVALTLASDTAYVLAYVGAAKVGAVTAGVNPRLTGPEQARCLAVADPALVLAHADEVRRLEVDVPVEALPPEPDRPVALVFTSGTTGAPKGAWFDSRRLEAVSRLDTGGAWGDPSAEPTPMLAGTQFAHVGFMTKLPWYLQIGSTTHVLARWRAADVLDVVERERMPSIGGVAPQVALLLQVPDFDRRDLSCVRSLIVGGGPSPPALVDEARRRFGAGYSIRYSSTESGGVGTGTALDAPDHEALHTVGRPRPGVEVRITDDDGRPVPDGEVGEVRLRSGAVMAGYWNDPESTAAALDPDGWLWTSDLGRIDEAGCLVLAGRRSDMYIRGGYNVHPLEVEAVLGRHPAVAQVAVVARPDAVMGEVGVAVVVPADPGAPPSLADLRAAAAGELAGHKLPEALTVVDALPLTAMQKIDRRALAETVLGTDEGE
jgi:acyl-CoA synthetase (AMP-forming)/AMP-acid ligase II